MSFSSGVKEELAGHMGGARHCRIAELSAIVTMCGSVCMSASDRFSLLVRTENIYVALKAEALIRAVFHVETQCAVRVHGVSSGVGRYTVAVMNHDDTLRILSALKVTDEDGEIRETDTDGGVDELLLQKSCCKRAFVRGAFIASGSISDPHRFYHLEIVTAAPERAEQLAKVIGTFGLEARITERKGKSVVYLKEGDQISDLLSVMEAPRSLMELENIRIVRNVNNKVNRQMNCETANINKIVNTMLRQVADIEYLAAHYGLERLPENLQETARIRLDHTSASLKELAELHQPPIGKSGVNHRLAKLSTMAEDLRKERGE